MEKKGLVSPVSAASGAPPEEKLNEERGDQNEPAGACFGTKTAERHRIAIADRRRMNREERRAESRSEQRRHRGGQLRGATADDGILLNPGGFRILIRDTQSADQHILEIVSESMNLKEGAEQEKHSTRDDAWQRS